MKYQTWKSPVGRIHLAANETALTALAFDDNWPKVRAALGEEIEKGTSPAIERALSELTEYFAGKRTIFTVPLELGGTPFQKRAWAALLKIPFGKTASYAEQAAKIKKPTAIRAVGRANGLNRISILVPCHRVISSGGSLTGYAGGLKAKKALLELEGVELS
jgi:methylated-DNA-[protein]-cysteine S-methyltransferase